MLTPLVNNKSKLRVAMKLRHCVLRDYLASKKIFTYISSRTLYLNIGSLKDGRLTQHTRLYELIQKQEPDDADFS